MARPLLLHFLAALCVAFLAGRGNAYSLNPSRTNITFTPGRRTLTAPLTVYIIWYGQWPDADKAIVKDFVRGLNTSEFWKINTMYYTANDTNPADRKFISSSLTLGPSVSDNYSLGKALNGVQNYDVSKIVYSHISQGNLPANLEGGIYLVLLDEHVSDGDYCSGNEGCAQRTSIQSDFRDAQANNRTITGIDPNFPDYAYGWIGHPLSCGPILGLVACGWHNHLTSPNGNPGVDTMISVIANTIGGIATNPDDSKGWTTADGTQNTDLCVYTYGGKAKEENGYWYNAQWNGRKYLMQQNWNPDKQLCGPATIPQLSDCAKLQSILPGYYLGDDCCNSGFADCANGKIRKLEIPSLNLQGSFSSIIKTISTSFPELEVLVIGDNPLTGDITDELCKLKKLEILSMPFLVNLTGTIPACLGDLKDLYVVSIRDSPGISGPIPASLTTLPKLQYLRLGNNNLNGTIPDFSKLPNLSYFEAQNNANLKGSLSSGFPAINSNSTRPGGLSGPIRACDLSGTAVCVPKDHKGPKCFIEKTC